MKMDRYVRLQISSLVSAILIIWSAYMFIPEVAAFVVAMALLMPLIVAGRRWLPLAIEVAKDQLGLGQGDKEDATENAAKS